MLGSVRGALSNERPYRDKDQILRGPRVFIRSKATCAASPCEVLTPCRGLRPHHVQRDRIGTWDISCLAAVVECVPSTAVRIGKAKIGRASCRERVERAVVAVAIKGQTKGNRRLR